MKLFGFFIFFCLVFTVIANDSDSHESELDRKSLLRKLNELTSSQDPNTQYRIGTKLGSGKWGIVFECTKLSTGEKFAIKKLSTERTKNIIYAINELTLGPFVHSLNAELQPSSKADVLSYDQSFHFKGFFWLVMELVPQGMTASQAARKAKLTFSMFETLMIKSLSMLSMLESHNICHRDFSASNVMIISQERERFVLLDFGRSVTMRTPENRADKDDFRYMSSGQVCSDRTKILAMAKAVHPLIKPTPRSSQSSRINALIKDLEALVRKDTSISKVMSSFQRQPKTEI